MVLPDLHKKQYRDLIYSSLLQVASEVNIHVTCDQARTVEIKTRDQAAKS